MAFGSILSRDNILKVAVVAVCLAFLLTISPFGSGRTAQTEEEQNQTAGPIAGTADVEGVILSYGKDLSIYNLDANASAAIAELEQQGLVEYVGQGTGGTLVLTLAKNADASEVAARFRNSSAQVSARARIGMPDTIEFTTSLGKVSATFNDIGLDLVPEIPVGQNITLRMRANLLNGEVLTYDVTPIAKLVSFQATASILDYSGPHYAILSIQWESRIFDDAGLKAGYEARHPNSTFIFTRNSSVLADLSAINFSQAYVVKAAQNMIDVNDSFIDRKRAEDDLLAAGVPFLPMFPDSTLLLGFEGEEDFAFASQFVNYSSIVDYRNATLGLPAEVVLDNRTFILMDRTLSATIVVMPLGTEMNLTLAGSSFGGRISKIKIQEE